MQKSWAIIFLDLRKAFDSVYREMAMGVDDDAKATMVETLVQRGAPREVAEAIKSYLDEGGSALERSGCSQKLTGLVRDWHTDAWAWVRQADANKD